MFLCHLFYRSNQTGILEIIHVETVYTPNTNSGQEGKNNNNTAPFHKFESQKATRDDCLKAHTKIARERANEEFRIQL